MVYALRARKGDRRDNLRLRWAHREHRNEAGETLMACVVVLDSYCIMGRWLSPARTGARAPCVILSRRRANAPTQTLLSPIYLCPPSLPSMHLTILTAKRPLVVECRTRQCILSISYRIVRLRLWHILIAISYITLHSLTPDLSQHRIPPPWVELDPLHSSMIHHRGGRSTTRWPAALTPKL